MGKNGNKKIKKVKKTLDFFAYLVYNIDMIKKGVLHMINIRTIRKLNNNDGLTLKNGRAITYKSGYQVATEGIETCDIKEAMKAIKAYAGNCGVWFSNGIYYIDKSKRISTKTEALSIGKAHNQISILKWSNMSLIYC